MGSQRLRWTPEGMLDVRSGEIEPIAERQLPPGFGLGVRMTRDYAPYDCPITGRPIEGRREHEENLKRHGVRVIERGEKEEAQRNKADQEKAVDNKITETLAHKANELGLTD